MFSIGRKISSHPGAHVMLNSPRSFTARRFPNNLESPFIAHSSVGFDSLLLQLLDRLLRVLVEAGRAQAGCGAPWRHKRGSSDRPRPLMDGSFPLTQSNQPAYFISAVGEIDVVSRHRSHNLSPGLFRPSQTFEKPGLIDNRGISKMAPPKQTSPQVLRAAQLQVITPS